MDNDNMNDWQEYINEMFGAPGPTEMHGKCVSCEAQIKWWSWQEKKTACDPCQKKADKDWWLFTEKHKRGMIR